MAAHQDDSKPAEAAKAPAPPPEPPKVDYVLQQLIQLVNKGRTGLGVTLSIGGSVISGELIAGDDYLEEIVKAAREAKGDKVGVATSFVDFLLPHQANYRDEQGQPRAQTAPQWIHLRNVRLCSVGQAPSAGDVGKLWRAKVSSVDGWSLTP